MITTLGALATRCCTNILRFDLSSSASARQLWRKLDMFVTELSPPAGCGPVSRWGQLVNCGGVGGIRRHRSSPRTMTAFFKRVEACVCTRAVHSGLSNPEEKSRAPLSMPVAHAWSTVFKSSNWNVCLRGAGRGAGLSACRNATRRVGRPPGNLPQHMHPDSQPPSSQASSFGVCALYAWTYH